VSKRIAFRQLYSSLISLSGLAAVQRMRLGQRVTIMTYHDIGAPVFRQHLEFLSRAYHIVSLAQALAGLRGETGLPPRPLAITFDDGFGSFYADVYPVLQRFQAPATVFLTTGYIGSRDILWFNWIDLALASRADIADLLPESLRGLERTMLRRRLMPYFKAAPDDERTSLVQQIRLRTTATAEQIDCYRLLSWDQAREMEKSSLVAFGGHTLTHPVLARASLDKARAEISGCAGDLERELGPAERYFAYPNGEPADFNDQIKGLVRQAGFACAVSALRGVCAPGDDLYALRRIAVDGSFSVAEVATKLSGLWVHLGRGGM
jgi:peptidoglycan/xylan/chitin deacetylase (PgdA/CDA1 family)